MKENITGRLIDFANSVTFDELPASAVSATKQLLLDSIGCGFSGPVVDRGKIAIEYAHATGGFPQASIIGDCETSYALASFVNGELINALDYDALGPIAGHMVPIVIPPCLAMAERENASGKDLIAALAMALELSGRLRGALGKLRLLTDKPPYWEWSPRFSNSIFVFGAVAGAAKLMNLDKATMANAFGIGGASTAVPAGAKWEHTPGPSIMTKYNSWAGWLAQLATVAALFAESGFTGDTSILDGEYGFWRIVAAPSWDTDALLSGLGKVWHTDTATIKLYPACGANDYGITAIKNIVKKHKISPEEIEQIEVICDPFLMTANRAGDEIASFQDTQFRSTYIFAMACYNADKPGPEWQLPSAFNDKGIRELMTKIKLVVHPQSDEMICQSIKESGPTMIRECTVELTARGKKWVAEGKKPAPMTAEQVIGKFRHNASFSRIRSDRVDHLIEILDNLEEIENIRSLTGLLVL